MSCGVVCRCSSDLTLLWLWCRLAAPAPVGTLAWEPPYTEDVAQKRPKKKERTRERERERERETKLRESQLVSLQNREQSSFTFSPLSYFMVSCLQFASTFFLSPQSISPFTHLPPYSVASKWSPTEVYMASVLTLYCKFVPLLNVQREILIQLREVHDNPVS